MRGTQVVKYHLLHYHITIPFRWRRRMMRLSPGWEEEEEYGWVLPRSSSFEEHFGQVRSQGVRLR